MIDDDDDVVRYVLEARVGRTVGFPSELEALMFLISGSDVDASIIPLDAIDRSVCFIAINPCFMTILPPAEPGTYSDLIRRGYVVDLVRSLDRRYVNIVTSYYKFHHSVI